MDKHNKKHNKYNKYNQDNIVAIATANGKAGVGIIRISGTNLLPLVTSLTNMASVDKIKPRYAHYVDFLDSTYSTSGIHNTSSVDGTININNAKSYIYTSAQQVADFGSNQTNINMRVYKINNVIGRGKAKVVIA